MENFRPKENLSIPTTPEDVILQQQRDYIADKYYGASFGACDEITKAEIDAMIENDCIPL